MSRWRLWIRLFLSLGNLLTAAHYVVASMWVLAGMRIEVFTGQPYEWPPLVVAASTTMFACSVVLLIATVLMWFRPHLARIMIVISILPLATLELIEFVLMQSEYGPIELSDMPDFAYLPLMLAWAATNAILIGRFCLPRPVPAS